MAATVAGEPVTDPLRLFIGYDSKEPVAFHVLAHSILTRATCPVSIIPLRQETLRNAGLYTRERNALESTEFSFTRFLVPYLSGYQGYSVFMDCDMLCRVDICELYLEIATHFEEYFQAPTNGDAWKEGRFTRRKALLCCQHDYQVTETTKFLGQPQTSYPRKNWSSFMVFANDMCTMLTPDVVNKETGLYLHRLQWMPDELIAPLPVQWNWLVGHYGYDPGSPHPWYHPVGDHLIEETDPPKILHWTNGGPWFPDYEDADHAEEWFKEREAMLGETVAA